MSRISYIVFFLLCIANGFAQDIQVKQFEKLEKDQTAVTRMRTDLNGTTCGLVKVALKEPGAEFVGNVMGNVHFTGDEYLVYLAKGTKRLGVKHPDYLPTTIVFADYGIKTVDSGTTYRLKVKANKKKVKVDNSKKGMAVFNIKPTNAMLLIDGQLADGSGGAYTLQLPYGTHYYTVKLNDFSFNQSVVVDKNAKNIEVDLTEYFARIEVSCKTKDADIFINGNLKGSGHVNELVIPGECIIEIRKDGFHSLARTLELGENEVSKVEFQEMKAVTGRLQVKTDLSGCPVYLDGKKIGETPMSLDVPVGDYSLELKKYCYKPIKRTIVISEDQDLTINEELELTQLGKIITSAQQGSGYGMCLLTSLYLFGSDNAVKEEYYGFHWGTFTGDVDVDYFVNRDLFIQEGERIDKNVEKAYYWFKKRHFNREGTRVDYWEDQEFNDALASLMWDILGEELYICYLTGDGVKQDYDIAFSILEVIPYGVSSFCQAWHYYYGKGVRKDTEKALELLNSLRESVTQDSEPYYVCNQGLLIKLARAAANHFQWDTRLLKFYESGNY